MKHDTYIKLYRKALNNPVRRHDPTAWHLFETLLLIADLRTGVWEGGRNQLAGLDGEKPATTIYKALKRLEKAKMVTLDSNTRYTRILICNWDRYQGGGNTKDEQPVNSRVTAREHSIKNKELRIKNNSTKVELTLPTEYIAEFKAKYPTKAVERELDMAHSWAEANGKTYKNWKQFYNYWLLKAPDKKGATHADLSHLA